jgi:hypothetical protein
MAIKGRPEENLNANRPEQSGSPPDADENDHANKHNQWEGNDHASRDEKIGPPQRLPVRNEDRLSEPILHEEEPRNAFVLNQSEGEERDQDEDRNDDDEYYSALEEFEGNEELEKTLPDKDIAQCIPDSEGHYSEEQVKLIAKDLYRIDCSDGRIIFIFEEKLPDGKKSKRTDLGFFVNGSLSSCVAKKPETIKGKSHAIENCRKGSFPNPCNRGEQLITRAFKAKYGYVPQFHVELANYTTSVSGNSEDVKRL